MRLGTLAALKAAEEQMKAAGAPLIGGVVSYDVHAHAVERGAFRAALAAAGFGTIAKASIPTHGPEQALSLAVTQVKATKRMAALEVGVPSDKATLEYGIWRGDPKAKSAGQEKPIMGARVRVLNGAIEVVPVEGATWPIPEHTDGKPYSDEEQALQACMAFGRQIVFRANRLLKFVETSDITGALGAVLTGFHAAKMADHGRGHFLLAQFVPQWAALMDALQPYGVTPRFVSMWGLPDHVAEAKESAKNDFRDKVLDLRKRLQEASGKSRAGGRGPRGDTLERAIKECVMVQNEAAMFTTVLGDLKALIEADVEAVRSHFVKLASGVSVVYGATDVDAPIFGEKQDSGETEEAPPEGATRTASGAIKGPDGTVTIPAGEPAGEGASA